MISQEEAHAGHFGGVGEEDRERGRAALALRERAHEQVREQAPVGQPGQGVEVGKMADLLVLDANPLDDLKNTTKISQVMKNGRLYDAATLNETYPRQKPLGTQWWWKVEPPKDMKGK